VHLRLTQSGTELMTELYPKFNAAESDVVRQLSARSKASLARDVVRSTADAAIMCFWGVRPASCDGARSVIVATVSGTCRWWAL
jgi:hypothetical protein